MKKLLPLLFAVPLALSACGGTGNSTPESVSATQTSSVSSTSIKASTSSSSPTLKESPSAAPVTAPPIEPQISAEPTVVECLEDTPGPALWSDGTTGPSDYCFNALGGPAYAEQESKSGFSQPATPDPSTISAFDGGTCPAYLCGYGHYADGTPRPSSGDVQTAYGCEQGYITDTTQCDAVRAKAEEYGW